MYIHQHNFIIRSPLVVPGIQEINNRLSHVLGSSIVLINITLMHMQQVLFPNKVSLNQQIDLMVDNISPDMIYLYVGGDESLIPEGKTKLKEDIVSFIRLSECFFQGIPFVKELMDVTAKQGAYIRANHVIDDIAPHITITVVKRF